MPNLIRHRLAGISFQAQTACPKSAALPPSLLRDSPEKTSWDHQLQVPVA
jgi:hypothetical protein